MFKRIINIAVSVLDMYFDPIRLSALISLALASIYILSPYVPICFLASCFIYYTHIDIASVPVLTRSIDFIKLKTSRFGVKWGVAINFPETLLYLTLATSTATDRQPCRAWISLITCDSTYFLAVKARYCKNTAMTFML